MGEFLIHNESGTFDVKCAVSLVFCKKVFNATGAAEVSDLRGNSCSVEIIMSGFKLFLSCCFYDV